MFDLTLRDTVYILAMTVAVAGSHFSLRGQVDALTEDRVTRAEIRVLEERLRGQSDTIQRIFAALQRIEDKLDDKADK